MAFTLPLFICKAYSLNNNLLSSADLKQVMRFLIG